MTRFNKHIAPFLLVIFTSTLIFQPVHSILHHYHGYCGNHFSCLAKSCNFSSDKEVLSQKEEVCPICEFQFSINDLPRISGFVSTAPAIVSILNEPEIQQPFQQIFTVKSTRAPPTIFS